MAVAEVVVGEAVEAAGLPSCHHLPSFFSGCDFSISRLSLSRREGGGGGGGGGGGASFLSSFSIFFIRFWLLNLDTFPNYA